MALPPLKVAAASLSALAALLVSLLLIYLVQRRRYQFLEQRQFLYAIGSMLLWSGLAAFLSAEDIVGVMNNATRKPSPVILLLTALADSLENAAILWIAAFGLTAVQGVLGLKKWLNAVLTEVFQHVLVWALAASTAIVRQVGSPSTAVTISMILHYAVIVAIIAEISYIFYLRDQSHLFAMLASRAEGFLAPVPVFLVALATGQLLMLLNFQVPGAFMTAADLINRMMPLGQVAVYFIYVDSSIFITKSATDWNDSIWGLLKFSELQVHTRLGYNAQGTVFLGFWRKASVVVKHLKLRGPDNEAIQPLTVPQIEEDLVSSTQAMGRLRNPNVALLYAASVLEDEMFLVYEHFGSRTLYDHYMRTNISWNWDSRLQVLADTAEAVRYLHSREAVHRGIKSTNVMLDDNLMVKLVDIGTAEVLSAITRRGGRSKTAVLADDEELSAGKRTLSIARWTAPEIAAYDQGYSTKSDVFSFGMLMFEVMALHVPFIDEVDPERAQSLIQNGQRPSLTNTHRAPRDYVSLMMKCWDQEPTQRPSMETVVTALKKMQKATLNGLAQIEGALDQQQSSRPSTTMMDSKYVPYVDTDPNSLAEQGRANGMKKEVDLDAPRISFLIQSSNNLTVPSRGRPADPYSEEGNYGYQANYEERGYTQDRGFERGRAARDRDPNRYNQSTRTTFGFRLLPNAGERQMAPPRRNAVEDDFYQPYQVVRSPSRQIGRLIL